MAVKQCKVIATFAVGERVKNGAIETELCETKRMRIYE